MLTIKYKEIKNNAYHAVVSMVAFTEGYQVKVEVQYCSPYFRLLEDEEITFLSREEAEAEYSFNLEWSSLLAEQALQAQEAFMQKCMNSNLKEQKMLEEIHNSLREAVPLELSKLADEYEEEVLIYQYFSLVVIEYFTDEVFGVNLILNREVIHSVHTMYDGTVSAETVLKAYLG